MKNSGKIKDTATYIFTCYLLVFLVFFPQEGAKAASGGMTSFLAPLSAKTLRIGTQGGFAYLTSALSGYSSGTKTVCEL